MLDGENDKCICIYYIPTFLDSLAHITCLLASKLLYCIISAGFIVTGFLDQAPIGKLLANIECNAVAGVNISHHFVKKLVSQKKKGCIVFTSSVAGFIPTPFAAMYAATKAFVSQFARYVSYCIVWYSFRIAFHVRFVYIVLCYVTDTLSRIHSWYNTHSLTHSLNLLHSIPALYIIHSSCLHIEVASLGIDVVAVHPSPVASNFYQNLDHKVDMIEAAAKNAVPPTDLPDDILRSIGGAAIRDLGAMAWSTRIGTFWLPYNFFARIFAILAPFMPDWKTHNKNRS